MDIYEAAGIVVGFEDAEDETDEIRALQALVNSGTWGLEGSVGRSMMNAIEAGYVALGHERARDYWGNTIPSRHDIEPGTKGSIEFVNEHSPFGVLED